MAGETVRVNGVTHNQLEIFKVVSTQVQHFLSQGAPASDIALVLDLVKMAMLEIAKNAVRDATSGPRVELAPPGMKISRS